MARIIYGVMGDARGHVSRALTVAREMPHHEFLFVGGGHVHALEGEGYPVEDVPMASTLYRNNRVDLPTTVSNAVNVFAKGYRVVKRVAQIVSDFDPDLILTDYEYFTPLAARRLGRPCVSLDHQHVLTHCSYDPPRVQRVSRFMTCLSIRILYSKSSMFLIISFYTPPPRDPTTTAVFPPLIRAEVRNQLPTEGDHVLVYQTSPTFHRLLPILEQMNDRFIVYGLGKSPPRNNLIFKAPSKHGFLHDLASCRYVVTNGGHNVISEALFLGKPVFSFPIVNAYEQFLNAYFLRRNGLGDYSTDPVPSPGVLQSFESRLDDFRSTIQQKTFFGNRDVINRLEHLASR